MFRDDYLMAVREHGPSSTTDTAVLYCLAMFWADWNTGGKCYPSDTQLARAVRCNPRYLTKVRKRLTEEGWLRITRHPGKRFQYNLTMPARLNDAPWNSVTGCETQLQGKDILLREEGVRNSVAEGCETQLQRGAKLSCERKQISKTVSKTKQETPPTPTAKSNESADGLGEGFSSDSFSDSQESTDRTHQASVIQMPHHEDQRSIDVPSEVPQAAYQVKAPTSPEEPVNDSAAPPSIGDVDFSWIKPGAATSRPGIEALSIPSHYAVALMVWHDIKVGAREARKIEAAVNPNIEIIGEQAFFAQVEALITTASIKATKNAFGYARTLLSNPANWSDEIVASTQADHGEEDDQDDLELAVYELLFKVFSSKNEAADYISQTIEHNSWRESLDDLRMRHQSMQEVSS